MKKIHVIITTYNRPKMLKCLLNDIFKYARGYDLSIDITDDGSSESYELTDIFIQCESKQKPNTFSFLKYYKNNKNQGKERYWMTINSIFHRIKQTNADYYFMLPDDVRLKNDFFNKAILIYDAINDTRKICLNLLLDKGRMGESCWTDLIPEKKRFNDIDVYLTGWNDLCFIAKKEFFKALNFKINEISSQRWNENKMLSSGVGRQISIRLYNAGYNFYQVIETLVEHGAHISKMNMAARQKIPIMTSVENNKITASMATIPSRIKYLQRTISSIIDQVDELHVYLNNFNVIPGCLNHPNIKFYKSQKHKGNLGDAGKFYKSKDIKGYHFTIDDDIIYPNDYVSTLCDKIEQYNRKYALSVHGRILLQPIKSYYRDSKSIHCRAEIISDTFVHVLGTGVLAYHTDTIKVSIDDFLKPNMADIWFALLAQKQKVGLCVIEHKENWLEVMLVPDTIHDRYKNNDGYQTSVINQITKWKIFANE